MGILTKLFKGAGSAVSNVSPTKLIKTLDDVKVKTTSKIGGVKAKPVSGGSEIAKDTAKAVSKPAGASAIKVATTVGKYTLLPAAVIGGAAYVGTKSYDYVMDVAAKTPEMRQLDQMNDITEKALDNKERNMNLNITADGNPGGSLPGYEIFDKSDDIKLQNAKNAGLLMLGVIGAGGVVAYLLLRKKRGKKK